MAMACSCTKHWPFPWGHGGHGGHGHPHCNCSIPNDWTCIVVPQTYNPQQGDLYTVLGGLGEVGASLTAMKNTHTDSMVSVPSTPYAIAPVFRPTGGSTCSLRTVRSVSDLHQADSLLEVWWAGVGGYAYKRDVTWLDSAHIILGAASVPFHSVGLDTFHVAATGDSVLYSRNSSFPENHYYRFFDGLGKYTYTYMGIHSSNTTWLIPR